MNDREIDLRGKSADEIYEAYADIATETIIQEEIFDSAGSLEQAIEIMAKIEEQRNKGNKENV